MSLSQKILRTTKMCRQVLTILDARRYLDSVLLNHSKFEPNGSKLGPKFRFSPFSQVWFISFPFSCIEW